MEIEKKHNLLIKVSFIIPSDLVQLEFVILFWDKTANNGAGGWVEMASSRIQAWLLDDLIERQEAWVGQPGIYVLVVRGMSPGRSLGNTTINK
jgi:hypothetical protein